MALGCILLSPQKGDAALIINVNQVGDDVIAEALGTVDVSALGSADFAIFGGGLEAGKGFLVTGNPTHSTMGYNVLTGPATFGAGASIKATSGSGDMIGVSNRFGRSVLVVHHGRPADHLYSGSSVWENHTLASLGLQTGSYVWTWGEGANADSLTINVIPEPASWVLLAGGAAATILYRRRLQIIVKNKD